MACTAAPDVWGVLRLRQQPQSAPLGDAASVLPFRAQWQGGQVLQDPTTGGTGLHTWYVTSSPAGSNTSEHLALQP